MPPRALLGFMTLSALSMLFFLPKTVWSQQLKNVRQIYEKPGYFLTEPTADTENRYIAICEQGNKTSNHLVYTIDDGSIHEVIPSSNDPFGDGPQINTWSLLWSPRTRGEFMVKITRNDENLYQIYKAGKLGHPAKTLSLKLDEFQLRTSQLLAWNPRGTPYMRLAKPGLNPHSQNIKSADYDIYILAGNNPQQLTQNPEYSEEQAALLGKDQLVFSARDQSNFNDLFLRVATGIAESINVTNSPGLSENWPQPSPDNRWIAYIITSERDNTGDLWAIPTQPPYTPRKMAGNIYFEGISPLPAGRFQWDIASRGIYYIKQDSEKQCPLEYVDFQSGAVTTVSEGIAFMTSFAITPDNRHILFIASGLQGSSDANTHKAYVAELVK